MAYDDIYSRYNNLFTARDNALKQKRDSTVQGYQTQQNEVNNQYTDLLNNLNNKLNTAKTQYATQKTDLANKYKNLYAGMDQQNQQAKDQNYTDRNQADTEVNQNLNRVQEIMAKNGWLGGGENLQAQLNSNSDRMNKFGQVDKSMNDKLLQILNDRNTAQSNETSDTNNLNLSEQNVYNDLNSQMDSTSREKTQKLQAIMDAINAANNNFGADEQSLKSELDAQAQKEIADIQAAEQQRAFQAAEAEKQRAYEAQQNALSRQVSASKSSNSASEKAQKEQITNAAWSTFEDEFQNGTADQWLKNNFSDIINSLGSDVYNQMVDRLNKYKSQYATNQRVNQVSNQDQGFKVSGGGRMLINE